VLVERESPGLFRYECEKRLRQDAEDKHCQILDKLGFDTRMHDQVAYKRQYTLYLTAYADATQSS